MTERPHPGNNTEKFSLQDNESRERDERRHEEDPSKLLVFPSLLMLGNYINYIEDISLLVFAEVVTYKKKDVLIQKNVSLSNKIFETLQSRKSEDLPPTFKFHYSKDLRARLISNISKKLYVCLDKNRFHIAHHLFRLANIDFLALSRSVLDRNRDILDTLVNMDIEMDPLLPHLGETALMSTALVDMACERKDFTAVNKPALIRQAFTAGLLHDTALIDDSDFLLNDIEFAIKSGHAQKSVEFINKNIRGIEQIVLNAIRNHHRSNAEYIIAERSALNPQLVISEILAFSEFFFSHVRSMYMTRAKLDQNLTDKVFFAIGQAIGEGFFHRFIFELMSGLQSRFRAILKYGEEIGNLERKCLFKNSAVAYPTPRCTQILCRKKQYDCRLIMPSFPIKIVNPVVSFGVSWKSLSPAEYPKCGLSEKLPPIPHELDSV